MDAKDEAQAKLAATDFKLGVWRHYKGGLYVVFALSLDEETLQPLVHYFSLEKRTRWTRAMHNFKSVKIEEQPWWAYKPRFTYERPASIDEIILLEWKAV